jgi:hypothetical protein
VIKISELRISYRKKELDDIYRDLTLKQKNYLLDKLNEEHIGGNKNG